MAADQRERAAALWFEMVEEEVPPISMAQAPSMENPSSSWLLQDKQNASSSKRRDWREYVALKVSTEYDSDGAVFTNKLSALLLGGLAKLKASFQREQEGDVRPPVLGFSSKHISLLYDHADRNALLTIASDLGSCFHLKYLRDIQAQQGELKLTARSSNAAYQAEISYDVPATGLPRASLVFPNGELKVEEEQQEEMRALSINGFVGAKVLNGLVVADCRDENLSLKYRYKDAEMTIAPTITVLSKSLALAFKRQFNPANKLSYLYNFDSAAWSAVYKHTPSENFKIKAGYDSDVQIAWVSAWVGKEDSGAKKAPRKFKVQIMLQVPQDNIKSSVLLFKVKKRWDL